MTKNNLWLEFEKMQGQIAAEIRVMLGEGPYDDKLFDGAQRERRVRAMQLCAEQQISDEARHDSWMKMHLDEGWVLGPTFDSVLKHHPNLLPWPELPASVRSKARIFAIIASAADEMLRML